MHSLHKVQCSQESLRAEWAADLSIMGSLSEVLVSALLVREEDMPWAQEQGHDEVPAVHPLGILK